MQRPLSSGGGFRPVEHQAENRPVRGWLRVPGRKALLACGIASSALYVVGDFIASRAYAGYSYADQTVSELSAVSAPTRPFMVSVLGVAYPVLVLGFGLGVWKSAGQSRPLRIAGATLLTYGAACLTAPFTPMHTREALAAGQDSVTDTLHITATIVQSTLILLTIGFGAAAFGKRFRWYSAATAVASFVLGGATGLYADAISNNEATPGAGLMERGAIFASMLWFAVFAAMLLRRENEKDAEGQEFEP